MSETIIVGLIPLVIVAIVELLKRLNKRDFEGVVTILVAALIGAGAGFLQLKGLDVTTGLAAGLEAVGLHTLVTGVASRKPA